MLLMSEVLRENSFICTALYEEKIKGYVKGVERDSKYTRRAVILCMSKVSKETQKYTITLMTFLLMTFLIFNQFSIRKIF